MGSVNILWRERVLTYKRVRMLSLSTIELGNLRLGLRLDLKVIKKLMLRENLRIVVGNKDMVAAGIVAFVVVAVVQRLYKK